MLVTAGNVPLTVLLAATGAVGLRGTLLPRWLGWLSTATAAIHLFVERGKHRVMAECDARNVEPVGVLARVGMRQEAHHVESAWWKGEWTDELVHAVLAREWAARPSSA